MNRGIFSVQFRHVDESVRPQVKDMVDALAQAADPMDVLTFDDGDLIFIKTETRTNVQHILDLDSFGTFYRQPVQVTKEKDEDTLDMDDLLCVSRDPMDFLTDEEWETYRGKLLALGHDGIVIDYADGLEELLEKLGNRPRETYVLQGLVPLEGPPLSELNRRYKIIEEWEELG